MYSLLQQKISLAGKSVSTLKSYASHLAKLALHYGRVPHEVDVDQINDYLYLVQQEHDTPSVLIFIALFLMAD